MLRNGVLTEGVYYPPEHIVAQANLPDYEAVHQAMTDDLAGYWGKIAREEFEWFEPWHTTLDESEAPFYKWFVGGKTNIVYNALDRHLKTWRRNKVALIWEGENYDLR